jgi:hypothetical protein
MTFYAPDCPNYDCDICAFIPTYFDDPLFEPAMTRDEFKQVAHSMTLDRLRKLAEQSRAACKKGKEAAKKFWASAIEKLKAQFDKTEDKTAKEDRLILGAYRRFSPSDDRLLG